MARRHLRAGTPALVDLATMVNDEYLLLDGLRFHVREWQGPSPDAPVIVLLHGFTGHARTWDRPAAALANHYRVLCPDARGHGESAWDPSGEYGVERQVADVVGLLGALGLARVTVLGLSMGGRTALNLAAGRPEMVERLVVVDIGPQVAPAGAARIGASVGAPDRFATPEDALAQARAGNAVAPEEVLRHRVRHNLLLLGDGDWTWRYDPALRRGGGSALPRPDVAQQWALLPRITASTLLVRGELSDVLSPEDARRMTREIPHCEMVEVPGAGHSVPLDRPDGFLDAIGPFLSI